MDNAQGPLVERPHAVERDAVLHALGATARGLSAADVAQRLALYGRNVLPRGEPPSVYKVFIRQFKSPLIYVLLLAAIVSLFLQEWTDAGFIIAVLLVNAIIGTYQEYSAERSAQALQNIVKSRARVLRDGETREINAEDLVPGDIVLLESGTKVPADLRLLGAHNLAVDESLLTGESLPVAKDAAKLLPAEGPLGERLNMAFAGTLAVTGRGRGVIVATAQHTELGNIATSLLTQAPSKPPLLLRMQRFTHIVAISVGIAALGVAAVATARGMPLAEVFVLVVALAVSAIPEGLPVALTVALAVGMQRMARRAVIVRRLVAVEALGSCTYIASDKTGTLTVNQLTVRKLQFPDQPPWEITGEGVNPEGTFVLPQGASMTDHEAMLRRLSRASVLANEGVLAQRDGDWVGYGDTVDVALLVMAHKAGLTQAQTQLAAPQRAVIPYESELKYAASLCTFDGREIVFVKGAVETLLPMCAWMAGTEQDQIIDADRILSQAVELAADGYRVLALADGPLELQEHEAFSTEHLRGLTLLGLVGLRDPLRPEVKDAVDACHRAGINVAMITGDHPVTALAIARELAMAEEPGQVVTGTQIARAIEGGEGEVDRLCAGARVFARIEPQQKLQIVEALRRQGHFVAVTGDGVNDAPALRAAHVGVAMGKGGTDVARETAELVITDDNFASIVAGIEEGRIAYANVRKVIFLLISTGAAEIVLFFLALLAGVPLPLLAVQLLWLNLVTNGIQDIALAFEPAEGSELRRPPRRPRERIFNQLMIERVLISAVVIGGLAFAAFQWMLGQGWSVEQARNGVLLLMVLFENVQAINSRSETISVFRHNLMGNKLLVFGTLGAQLIHVAAMYTPGVSDILGLAPVSLEQWGSLLLLALGMLAVMELHKLIRQFLLSR